MLLFCFLSLFANTQEKDSLGRPINKTPASSVKSQNIDTDSNKFWLLTDKETKLAYAVLLFLFAIVVIEVWLIYKMKVDGDNAIKLLVTTLVLMSILFIIMTGYDDKVLAPSFGLFGTVLGYLFGRTQQTKQ